MRRSIVVIAAALAVSSMPAVSSAQSSGSLGSLGGESVPAEHTPNPQEPETINEMNDIIVETYEMLDEDSGPEDGNPWGADGPLGDPIVLVRDADVSQKAQYGAEKLVEIYPDSVVSHFNELRPNILVSDAEYLEVAACGPAPLTVDEIGDAYRASNGYAGSLGDISYSGTYPLFSYEEPLVGVGYAEHDGHACSYALLRSANYPFR